MEGYCRPSDQDIEILGERSWKSLALNKEKWKKLMKKA
jgi:hypothetical protein